MSGKDILSQIAQGMSGMSSAEIAEAIQRLTTQLSSIAPGTPSIHEASNISDVSQKNPLQRQTQNSYGGYSYEIDNLTRLKRYLILGTSRSDYSSTRKPDVSNTIPVVNEMIRAGNGQAVIDTIVELNKEARISREEHFLIVLRDCIMFKGDAWYDQEKKITIQRAAYDNIVKICNIPTKLFRLIDLCHPCFEKDWKPSKNTNNSKTQEKKRKRAKKKAEENQHAQKMAVETCEVVEPEEPPTKKKKKKKKSTKKKKTPTRQSGKKFKRSSCWGRARMRGIASFYTDDGKDANRLLLLLTKYKSRHNWDHKQVLGYCHPKMKGAESKAKNIVMEYVTRGYEKVEKCITDIKNNSNGCDVSTSKVLNHIEVLEKVKKLQPGKEEDQNELIELLKVYGKRDVPLDFGSGFVVSNNKPAVNKEEKRCAFQLTREHIPNGFLKLRVVWEALLQDMPMTAMIRNLGKMTNLGIFENTNNVNIVKKALSDAEHITKARIHPIKLLLASKMYEQGHGDTSYVEQLKDSGREQLRWSPVQEITEALDKAFYLSFKQPDKNCSFRTGKKFFLAMDVSGSMEWGACEGCPFLTPAVASFAMAMVTLNTEENCGIYAFGGQLICINDRIRKEMTVQQALSAGKKISFGSTDCALPMMHALKNKLDVDVFIVYTDSETWVGKIHPSEALKKYRREMNKPDAKLIVMAMKVNDFSIADSTDKGMLDVCGFDSNVPDIVCEFAKGNLS